MDISAFRIIGFIAGLNDIESYLAIILVAAIILFFVLDVCLFRARRQGRLAFGTGRCFLCLVLMTAFIMSGFIFASKALLRYEVKILDKITAAYDNVLMLILHIVVIILLAVCSYLLMFCSPKNKHDTTKKPIEPKQISPPSPSASQSTSLSANKSISPSSSQSTSPSSSQSISSSSSQSTSPSVNKSISPSVSQSVSAPSPSANKSVSAANNHKSSDKKQDKRGANSKKAGIIKPDYSSYFSRFECEDDDASDEVFEVKDVFRGIGNNQWDIQAFIDRMANKLSQDAPDIDHTCVLDQILTTLSKNEMALN